MQPPDIQRRRVTYTPDFGAIFKSVVLVVLPGIMQCVTNEQQSQSHNWEKTTVGSHSAVVSTSRRTRANITQERVPH
jgi:hypothetical protein